MNELTRLEDQLLDIEARIALLEACRPVGIGPEEARLETLLRDGAPEPQDLVPRIEWPRRPDLELERVRLEQVGTACSTFPGANELERKVACLLAERATELSLEIDIVQARGTRAMVSLARQRFQDSCGDGRAEADRLAEQWLVAAAEEGPADARSLVSLAEELRRRVTAVGLTLEVLEVDMAARAAVTGRALLVRTGARVTVGQAERIFTHEVFGHWLPRAAAAASGCPFRIGPRGADADEEGRALHLEMLSGQVDGLRRAELAVRHLLAASVLDGVHPGEALLVLRAAGASVPLLARAAPRVMRGGGLCREVIYLPALLRVGPRLADPAVEEVFRRGRVTLAEATTLRELLAQTQAVQSRSTKTGV